MQVSEELGTFFIFVLVGALLGIIFDIFRALRKIKKANRGETFIQDLIYFIIVGIVLLIAIYYTLNAELRIHIFIAILIGIMLYMSTISNIVIKFYVKSMETIIAFFKFLFIPITVDLKIIAKIVEILKKITINCCKKLKNMVSCMHSKLSGKHKTKKKNNFINKRGFLNGFKRKEKTKKGEYKLD